jgi:hypothetical protein
MLDCDCPRCGSKNTKALPVVHENGTHTSTYRKSGLFYYQGSVGLHASTTRGVSQTVAARRAAVPDSLQLTPAIVAVILFIGLLLGGEIGFSLALVVLVAVTVLFALSGVHEQIYREWSSTFRCNRCGTTFAVLEQEPPTR